MNRALSILPVITFIFMMVAVSGCAPKNHITAIKPPLIIPAEMYECYFAVPRPHGNDIRESEVAKYIASLEYSAKDCRIKMKELKILTDCYNEPDCKIDKMIELLKVEDENRTR